MFKVLSLGASKIFTAKMTFDMKHLNRKFYYKINRGTSISFGL